MRFVGRRTLLIVGHIAIAIIHASISLFNIEGINLGVIAMIMCFSFTYTNTTGATAWIYATETTIDPAMGISLFTLWGTVFVSSLIFPLVLDKDTGLGPNVTFFILSGISLCGSLYMMIFIKETMGKSDREKKLLYTPQQFWKSVQI